MLAWLSKPGNGPSWNAVIARKIRALIPPADISDVMGQVEDLLDESIDAEGYVIRETAASFGEGHRDDLAKIDFEALKESPY